MLFICTNYLSFAKSIYICKKQIIDYATHILRYGDINAIYTTNGSYDNLANEIETNYKNR